MLAKTLFRPCSPNLATSERLDRQSDQDRRSGFKQRAFGRTHAILHGLHASRIIHGTWNLHQVGLAKSCLAKAERDMQRVSRVKIGNKLAAGTTLLDLVPFEPFEKRPDQDGKLILHPSFDETPYHLRQSPRMVRQLRHPERGRGSLANCCLNGAMTLIDRKEPRREVFTSTHSSTTPRAVALTEHAETSSTQYYNFSLFQRAFGSALLPYNVIFTGLVSVVPSVLSFKQRQAR